MGYRYAIVGSGRQGTAAAYDLIRFGDAETILMADADVQQAKTAAARVNSLTEREVAFAVELDAADEAAVSAALEKEGIQAIVSAVPYFLNLGLTRAAIAAGAGMTDLGGNSQVVLDQLALSPQAEAAGVSVVPDCGQVPGMGTSLVLYAMEQLDEPRDVWMWDCGLPAKPEPPWNYSLTFNIEGLTNEYYGDCLFIREGKRVGVPVLEELETVEFPPPIGPLEGFTTSGGLTTAARSFEGVLRTLQNKTLRYPGHFAQLKTMQALGLLELDAVEVNGKEIVPRTVLHTLWEPQIRARQSTRDFVLTRIEALGMRAGRETRIRLDFVHHYDEATGFTAMEQATGWHAAIMTIAIATGRVQKGVIPVEMAMSGSEFVEQAALRGFKIELTGHAA